MKKASFVKNSKNILIATTAGAVLVAGSVLGYYNYHKPKTLDKVDTETSTLKDSVDTGSQATTGTSNPSSPSTATAPTNTVANKIVVSVPRTGSSIEPGITVVGGTVTATQGGDLYYMIKGEASGVLVNNRLQAITNSSVNTPYTFTVSFDRLPKGSESAILEVYLMNGTQRLDYTDVGVRI